MLKEIFDSILPDNIKDIQLVQDATDIFIKNLEDNSKISIQIRDMFKSDNVIIKENLFKIYLNSLYTILEKLQEDQTILKKLEDAGRTNALLNNDINDILNEEYFITSKSFKQTKGTKLGIEYAYNLTKKIEGNTNTDDLFDLIELKPFHFRTEGTIFKEMYESVVKPLSHPIGFTHTYQQIIKSSLTDLFGIKYDYDVKKVEVRCIDGYFDVFTSDANEDNIKADFLSRTNLLTGNLFTEEEFYDQVNINYGKNIASFVVETQDEGTKLEILFDDDTLLEQYPSPLEVYYRRYIDELLNTDNYLKQYSSHCSLYVEYDQDFSFTYTDSLAEALTVNLSKIDNLGNALKDSEIFYGIIGIENSFKVGGDEYSFTQGTDELLGDDSSTASYVDKLIGQLKDDTFSPEDTLVNGLYTEGNNYVISNIDDITNEEMFINEGRSLFPTNSTDHFVMTNTSDLVEDFEILQIGTGGNYLTAEDPESLSPMVDYVAWESGETYGFGQIVQHNGIFYASIVDDNINIEPEVTTDWESSWKNYLGSAETDGFYIYSLVDQFYFYTTQDI